MCHGTPTHGASTGKTLVPLLGEHLETLIEDHDWGWRVRTAHRGSAPPGMLEFRRPNQMNLRIPMSPRRLILAVACVPVGARRTRLLLVTARNFACAAVFDVFFNRADRRTAAEDRAIVESLDPPECVFRAK